MKRADKENLALAPYRVLDLADESGAFCPKILAALGADVIKIEPPGGDPTRRIGPFYHDEPDPEKSLHWFTYNLNKRSITLNIECTTGQELFKRLVKTADFLVECFRPDYLDKLGLGFSVLNAINPRLIHVSITPFGAGGPYGEFKGSALVCAAMSVHMYVTGDEDRPPVELATPIAYIQTGLEAAAATLVAHWYREQIGEGQHLDVSVQESMMSQYLSHTLAWKSHGYIPRRTKTGPTRMHGGRTPEIYQCQDGLVVGAIGPARGRQAIREWLASEGKAGDLFDKKWDDIFLKGAPLNLEQKTHIDKLFQDFALHHTRDELMSEAQRRDIQVVKEQDVRDVMDDPHLREREYFVKVKHPELNESIIYPGAPFKSTEMSWQYSKRAPYIGEHNHEIYVEELGLTIQELAILKEGGVI